MGRKGKRALNKLVDSLFHKKIYKDNIYACLIDSFLHFAVEDNLLESIEKFLKYNLGWLMRCLRMKKRRD